jgi:4-methyl-5(b-hydroxyethyl)-thiazole monophosphate biosynthesis
MKKVLLLLADGFEIYEASAFIDVIGWNLLEGDKSTQLFTCALKKEIKSTFNQRFIVDFTIDQVNIEEYAALAIPGGFEEYGFYKDAYYPDFLDVIRKFENQQKTIASICTGALPVAESNILQNRNGTTYNLNPVRQNALRDKLVNVLNQPIVEDGNIITSWNPSTAMDVAFLLLEKLTSKENTNKVKRLMGFN